jgi:hypothetical protein
MITFGKELGELQGGIFCIWEDEADMSEREEIVFMQVRLLRIASEEWQIPIQRVSLLFDKYNIFKFIEECYDVFHMEGDDAVFDEIKMVLKGKGVDVNAGII